MIKLILNLLVNLFTYNKYKCILLIFSLILFTYAGEFEDYETSHRIVHQAELEGYEDNYLYVHEKVLGNELKFDVKAFNEPQEIVDGRLIYYSYNDLNVLFWVLFGFFLVIVLIGTIINDEDMGWETHQVWRDSLTSLIYSEEENGEFYYMALGRLLHKSDKIKPPSDIIRMNSIDSLSNILSFPRFRMRSKKREDILKKIGIN